MEWSRWDTSDIDGQTNRSNGAFGKSDIEGKAAMVAARKLGSERVSNGREAHNSVRQRQSFKRSAGTVAAVYHRRCSKKFVIRDIRVIHG